MPTGILRLLCLKEEREMFNTLMTIWNVVLAMCSSIVGMDMLYAHEWIYGGALMLVCGMAMLSVAHFSKRLNVH